MRRNSRSAALFSLMLAVLFVAQALPQQPQPQQQQSQRIVGKALYEKLQREGRRMMGGSGGFGGGIAWTPDGKGSYAFEDGTFKRTDILTGEKTPLFDDAKLLAAVNTAMGRQEAKLFFNRFQYLDDGKKITFQGFNKVFIYDLASSKLLSYDPERSITGVRGRAYGDVLSPNLKYRTFTRDYDLYIKDMDGNETALTTGGTEDLRNGYPDWVYPEELAQYEAFWWSRDSTKIAFMQFDESPVAKYPIVHDIAPMPRFELQGYPVPGANNPIVRLFIVDVKTKK
ncbi:MAG: DPP IV N-terminal domain-containing protein, partial [Candidatus Aminicenantales bacterium]